MKLCKKIVEQRTSIIHELGTKNNKFKIKFQMSDFCYQISYFCIPLSRCLFIKKLINFWIFFLLWETNSEFSRTVSRIKEFRSHFALAFSIYLKYIPIHIYYNVTCTLSLAFSAFPYTVIYSEESHLENSTFNTFDFSIRNSDQKIATCLLNEVFEHFIITETSDFYRFLGI